MNLSLQHKIEMACRLFTAEDIRLINEAVQAKVNKKPKPAMTEQERYRAEIKRDLIKDRLCLSI